MHVWIARISTAAGVMSGVGVWLMVGLIVVEMLDRAFLSRSTLVAEELSSYLLTLLIFFGIGYTLKEGRHVRVTGLINKLPASARRGFAVFACLIALAYVGLLSYEAEQLWQMSHRDNTLSLEMSRTPLWIPQLAMPIGGALIFLQFASLTLQSLRGLPEIIEGHEHHAGEPIATSGGDR